MTVNEMLRENPEIKETHGSTFSGWVEEQLLIAREYGHPARIAKFEMLKQLLIERQFLLARFWVPVSDEATAEALLPEAELSKHYALTR
jgi:hypothetical protein